MIQETSQRGTRQIQIDTLLPINIEIPHFPKPHESVFVTLQATLLIMCSFTHRFYLGILALLCLKVKPFPVRYKGTM
jgi:hypothetical protein